MEYATLECVDRFNNRQNLKPIGIIPPTWAEYVYYSEQNSLTIEAERT